jgi:hypothetical protein
MSKTRKVIKVTKMLVGRAKDKLICIRCKKVLVNEKEVFRTVNRNQKIKYYCISCAKEVNLI